jgi:hypothetical protein
MQSPVRDNRIRERIDAIEACCDFMQACGAQGLSTDSRARSGRRLRVLMAEAISAMKGIAEHCATVIDVDTIEAADRLMALLAVLDRDAGDSLAAMELVLAQPVISSWLIDNLNGSVHLRGLLGDLVVLSEVYVRECARPEPQAVPLVAEGACR